MTTRNGLSTISENSISHELYLTVKRTHRYMLNTFISLLVLGFIHLPLNTYSLIINDSAWPVVYYRRIYMMIINVILIGLYGLGLFVLHKHSRTGLLAFAWLVAILDVIATIAVLSIIFVIIFLIPPISAHSWEILTGMILFILLALVGFTFMAISITHACRLSKLIKENKQVLTEV